ncbi:MAG: methyltransferase domain-containing protein [Deltaproteobacteria bacterium]|nr:methyltransferase domain-containing protein [Deltaproteobacteria bacterium]
MLPGLAPRLAAAVALQLVERDRAYLTKALDDAWRPFPTPSHDDRAFSTELALGTCRWRGILDAALDPLLPRGLESLDDITRQILRLAAYELLGPHPTPPHAAVHLAVEAAKQLRNPSLSRLVNGVLRSLTRSSQLVAGRSQSTTRSPRPSSPTTLRHEESPPDPSGAPKPTTRPDRPTNDQQLLSALPPWLFSAFSSAWGEPAALALSRWSLDRPTRSLRLNRRHPDFPSHLRTNDSTGRNRTAPFRARLGQPRAEARGSDTEVRPPGDSLITNNSPVLPLPPGAGDLRSHHLVASGAATPQEHGAYLVAEALPLRSGAIVLDACAGRGTKTTALAERLPPDATLLAADVNPDKLARLAPELQRLGLPPVETLAVDWSVGVAGIAGSFDAILVDAPCSGTGTLSRRPEIRWRLDPSDIDRLAALQSAILRRTASLLAPGGMLLYAVCSLLPAEGPEQMRSLLSSSPGLLPVPGAFPLPWHPLDIGAALLPHESGTDGFYAALLRRP